MSKRAFSLVEILCVIAIVSILAAILFPVFAKAKLQGNRATSISQMRQLAAAQLMYSSDYAGAFAVARSGHYSWQDELETYLPNVSSFHPPLFANPSRTSGPSGYVVNECLTDVATAVPSTSQVVLYSEYADVFVESKTGTYQGLRFIAPFPDTVFLDYLTKTESEVVVFDGIPGATKYFGKGVYAFLDGHVASFAPEQFYAQDPKNWCHLISPIVPTGATVHFALF